jgi:hypothetical protein
VTFGNDYVKMNIYPPNVIKPSSFDGHEVILSYPLCSVLIEAMCKWRLYVLCPSDCKVDLWQLVGPSSDQVCIHPLSHHCLSFRTRLVLSMAIARLVLNGDVLTDPHLEDKPSTSTKHAPMSLDTKTCVINTTHRLTPLILSVP